MAESVVRVLLPMGAAGGLFYALLWLLARLSGYRDAALRKGALLAAAVLFLLPLPLLGAALPAQGPMPAPAGESAAAETAQTGPDLGERALLVGQAVGRALNAPVAAPSAGAKEGPPLRRVLAAVYLGAALLAAGVSLFRYARFKALLLRRSAPWDEAEAETLYRQMAAEMGIARPPALRQSEAVGCPILAGVLRPVLVLPRREWQAPALGYALGHELTHYRQKDLHAKLLLQAVCALHWCNPFAYLLRRDYALTSERRCDSLVTKGCTGPQRRAYAALLLSFAGQRMPGPACGLSGGARRLRRRLGEVLRPAAHTRGQRIGGACVLSVLLLAVLLAGCGAGVGGASSAAQTQPPASSSPPPAESEPAPADTPTSRPAPASAPSEEEAPEYAVAVEGLLCPLPESEGLARDFGGGHRGVDFLAAVGTPVLAAHSGMVTTAAYGHDSYGNYIALEDKETGLVTLYAHCETLAVAAGDEVQRGETIATVGQTGHATGALLHFETMVPVRLGADGTSAELVHPEGLPTAVGEYVLAQDVGALGWDDAEGEYMALLADPALLVDCPPLVEAD